MDLATAVTFLLTAAILAAVTGNLLLRSPRDPVTLLTVLLGFLMLLSARLVFTPMGGVGTPAIILGLVAMCWWLAAAFVPSFGLCRGFQPARWIILGYVWYLGVGYVIGHSRALTDLEVSGSDRGMIGFVAMSGAALLAADGIRTRARLDVLLRRLVWLTGIFASFGVVQFVTRIDIVQYMTVPGLSPNRDIMGMGARSGFGRPASTALHPIEFSVVLSMVLPLALHFALYDPNPRRRRMAQVCVGLIAAGVPMSLSRTGIFGIVVAFAFMFAAWTWRRRIRSLVVAFVFSCFLYVAIPGLLGSIRSMFGRVDTDPSITDRVDRMPAAMDLWSERFWFGMGTKMYSPEDYFLLDNQVYVTAIENGLVGVGVTVAFLVGGIWLGTSLRRRGADPATSHLGQALVAPLAVILVTIATFDAFYFKILTTLMFLFVGLAGALWRIERHQFDQPNSDNAVITADQSTHPRASTPQESSGWH